MQAPGSRTGRFYRPELDVVRFVAFLLVFLFHAQLRDNDLRIYHLPDCIVPVFKDFEIVCGYGLSLFFTLSAFLIGELLLREREASGTVGVKRFYIRRILRIWPLYYLALAFGVIVAFLPGDDRSDVATLAWFAIFMGAWHSAMYGWIKSCVSPLWSISVEEQFYLFAPWVIKYFSRKLLYGFCATLLLVSNCWIYYLGSVRAIGYRIWACSIVQFECFAAGILLCLVLHNRMPKIVLWHRLILIAGCCFCWMTAIYGLRNGFSAASDNPGSWPLIGGYALASLGCVMLLVAFLGADRKLLPGWAIYLGRISYGLYVYHGFALGFTRHILLHRLDITEIPTYPLQVFLAVGLTIGLPLSLTILMAALSYRYFETPFLKMKRRFTIIESQPIAGES